ncbi:hypothetical protein WME89_28755 [Sorangium sp. So ce321]|uniref:hypothetical protein n=1 Tax=Sorangium sp. So ce321 TaxID=3133300 RepID=UPI003F5D9587
MSADGQRRHRREFGGFPADLLARRIIGVRAIVWLGMASVASMALPGNILHGLLLGLALFGFGCGGAPLAARLFTASRVGIVVGSDGILVRGQFVPYSEIGSVRYESWREPGYGDDMPTLELSMSLELVDGDRLQLANHFPDGLRDAIDEARAAWAAGELDPEVESDVEVGSDAVACGERTGLDWLRALRGLGLGAAGGYRTTGPDAGQMSRLLDDVRSRPWARAAAAIVLAASGDATATSKLRIAAEATANPLLRARLKEVADARDDAALAEALEALDEADREEHAG